MGSHHDHNDQHSSEKKPVSFTVPLIFGSVIVFIIVLLVSLGDPKHDECCCKEEGCSKECMEQCEKNGHHGGGDHKAAHMGEMKDHSHEENSDTMSVSTSKPEVTDTTAAKTEHKEEVHH